MNKLYLAGVAAIAGSLAVAAIANAEPAMRRDPAKFHQTKCTDRYAAELGRLTYLETKLNISTSQRTVWNNFRDAMTTNAKSDEQACLKRPTPSRDHPPSVVEGSLFLQKRLETKLAQMKAVQPSLEAVYGTLNADQKTAFDRAAFRAFEDHMGDGRGHGKWRRGEHGERGGKPEADKPVEQ